MIYFESNELFIRSMQDEDAEVIALEEEKQGWDRNVEKYLTRLKDQRENRCVSMVAVYRGEVAGYINVYFTPKNGPFAGKNMCEIKDFGVLEKFRRRGIGSSLMDAAEAFAAQYADVVSLGVGLYPSYGSAQRMYVKRGYIPDGSGVWYRDKNCPPYADVRNDDDLVLYLSKKLR